MTGIIFIWFLNDFSSLSVGCSRWQQWWRINSHAFESPSTFWPLGWLWYDWLWGHSFPWFAYFICFQVMIRCISIVIWSTLPSVNHMKCKGLTNHAIIMWLNITC